MATPIIPAARPMLAYSRETGEPVALVPSCSKPGSYHLVTLSGSCDCRSYYYRQSCSHLATAAAIRFPVATRPAPLPCASCKGLYHSDVERAKAHPDANPLREGGRAHLQVLKAAGSWPR